MSYRELRDFTEHMKTLGYPSALSHASFRQPNFALVASCLLFLLRRYDPTLITADDISTQQARITFVQSITQLLWSKCNVKLSMKQLYRADGYAVKEMLKLSAVLYAAMAANTVSAGGSPTAAAATSPSAGDVASSVPASLDAFKAAKALATSLIDTADRLSELLGRESAIRVARDTAITFVDQLNETSSSSSSASGSNNVERHIKRQLQLIADNTAELKQLTASTTADVDKQRTKLDRKSQERDRLTKRWQALRRVKPAFMDEYEREERELRGLYGVYVERVRNVRWLEDEMRAMREEEEEERKERERARGKVQKRMKEEERRMLRGEGDDDGGSEDDDEEDEEDEDEDDEEGAERDEKRVYERKDKGGDEDDEDEDDEGEGDEDDEDEDELDSASEHKRPARRPPQKQQPASRAIVRGRGSSGSGGVGGGGGGGKGRTVRNDDMGMGSESDGSGLGDDDYF